MWVIRLPNWTPVSLNAVKSHWLLQYDAKRDMCAAILKAATTVLAPGVAAPATGWSNAKVSLVGGTYRPRRRMKLYTYHKGILPDPDNLTKYFLDACKLAGIIADDKQAALDWYRPVVSRAEAEPYTVICLGEFTPKNPDPWPYGKNPSRAEVMEWYYRTLPMMDNARIAFEVRKEEAARQAARVAPPAELVTSRGTFDLTGAAPVFRPIPSTVDGISDVEAEEIDFDFLSHSPTKPLAPSVILAVIRERGGRLDATGIGKMVLTAPAKVFAELFCLVFRSGGVALMREVPGTGV